MFFKANFRSALLAIIVGTASILPAQVLAIGLGEIQLNSSLNEPLNAEIQLLQVHGLSQNDILVGIAPKADFEAAGVDRLFFLSSLKFSLELDNPKGPLVRIKTDAPVREPYLNFLLQVQWPSGRLLREYTLLMDLPALADGKPTARLIKGTQAPVIKEKPKLAPVDVTALEAELAEVDAKPVVAPSQVAIPAAAPAALSTQAPVEAQAAATNSDETQSKTNTTEPAKNDEQVIPAEEALATEQKPAEMTKPAEEPAQAASIQNQDASGQAAVVPVYSSTPAEGDYSVQKGENLWLIAVKYRQQKDCTSRDYSCEGITMQQTMLTMQRLNPDAFIHGNINLLKKGKVLRMPTYDDLTEMTSREAVAEVRRQNVAWSGDPNGRKTAAPVEQLDATYQATATAEAPAAVEEGHLKLSVPGSATSGTVGKASGTDTGAREALQNELSISMEELDRIKREKGVVSDKLAGLNDQANTVQQMLEVRSAELAALQAALANKQKAQNEKPVEPDVSVGTAVEAASLQPAPVTQASVAPVEQVAATAPSVAPVTEDTTKPSSGIIAQLQNNLVWLIGGVLTLVLIVFAAIKLRKRKTTIDFSSQDEEVEKESATDALDEEMPADEHGDLDDSLTDSLDIDEDLFEEAPAEAKPETGDVIGEADIYISFGTYDKAESLLKSAIASEPKRTDLRLKLLEVYVGMENLKAFDKQLEELTRLNDAGATERAREMRNRISGASNEDVMSSAPTAITNAVTNEDTSLDFDLDLSEEAQSAGTGGDLDLDFDLDLDLDDTKEDSTQKTPKVSISDAPTVQQRAIDISEMQTAVTPAVKVSEAKTAARESLDLDLSDLDAELKEFDAIPDTASAAPAASSTASTAVYDAIANDAPTPKTDLDEEFDFLADADEAATKLDLARAYIDMGDKEGAKDILQEVIEEGQDTQKNEARKLLAGIS